MMKSTFVKHGLLLAGLLMSACALAQFVWIDEHGVKQFSDTAPPSNIPQNHILKQPHRDAARPTEAPAADAAAGSDAAKAPPSVAEKNADFNKRKTEQAEKDKKTAEDAKRKETDAANCARTKQYLDELNTGERIRTTGSDGQPAFMDDDKRAKEVQRAQQALADCNKG
ncbi:MAG TPA: DUF4124 domain-containing protein [Burkholderiaceae bacterium]